MRVICDIETNGLTDVTNIWCIVAKEYGKDNYYTFTTPDEIYKEFPKFAKGITEWIGHNFLSYDAYWLNQLTGTNIQTEEILDTLLLSRLFCIAEHPEHSLEYYGRLLGSQKIEHTDFTKYSEEMLKYCKQDVALNEKVFDYLRAKSKGFSKLSIRLEHSVTAILNEQKRHGFKLDVDKTREFYSKLKTEADNYEAQVLTEFGELPSPIVVKDEVKTITPKIKKDGSLSTVGIVNWVDDVTTVGGTFCPVVYKKFNIRSVKDVIKRMDKAGWQPVEFTKNGSPKVSETNLETLPDTAPEVCKNFVRLRTLRSRLSLIDSWYEALGSDGRIHGSVISVGAWTHRMAHQYPNTANIPNTSKLYGAECRELWVADKDNGYMLMGTDAAGIQLRILAHLMNDNVFTQHLLHGDIHTFNQNAAGFDTRGQAKTFIYAFLLGAGFEKIGMIAQVTEDQAKDLIRADKSLAIRVKRQLEHKGRQPDYLTIGRIMKGMQLSERFFAAIPALKELKQVKMKEYAEQGWLPCWDGRRLPCESQHKALASALQGYEATLMKLALTLWVDKAKQLNYDAQIVGNIHDEWQTEFHKSLVTDTITMEFSDGKAAEKWNNVIDGKIWSKMKHIKDNTYVAYYSPLGQLQVESIIEAGKILKSNCPMDGEYKLGFNWHDTH